ncbi:MULTISPECIES: hypothetical protein [Ralstonia solanacearum species complex]|uniref:Uncharacterized protein n=4 Tax=Ralstonia solanacearum TaxID=305 RepID=A0ABF7REJ0_RALSL|nr:hypothetical protein [Ralstonia solanacearum]ALF87520.1 hypothetical protein RSUY_11510 [Ralstonia solanacearum]ATI27038.1 hypothetical protein CCY86_05745 [Ralstonia solanacearum]ATJ85806.1 hypothetical protein CDC59_05700 [Ralstonia solanacearum]EAP73618.1 Hypothetical Protein RRSL_03343 [Ralstonia solanacearum UW551]KEI33620.1 hypothetical protein CQ06_09020 [Ralstonia solanacearum]
MHGDKKMMSGISPAIGRMPEEANACDEHGSNTSQLDASADGWDELDAEGKAQKEIILEEHFVKALERFNAGVSLAKIRRHYEKLGAKYSPITFRKKWDELLKRHNEQV